MTQRDQAYAVIRKAILKGEVPIGETLSERELTEEYLQKYLKGAELGRTPIREALAVLALRGLVRQFPQVGFDVPSVSAAEARRTVRLRHAMERVIVGERPTDLGNIGAAIDGMKRAGKDGSAFEFITATRDFHIAMCQGADYAKEAQGVGAFVDRLQLYFCSVGKQLDDAEMEHMANLYEDLVDHLVDTTSALEAFDKTAGFELSLVESRQEAEAPLLAAAVI